MGFNKYVLQVKKLHEVDCVPWQAKRTSMAAKALVGRARTQGEIPSRLAMTPDVMWLLK